MVENWYRVDGAHFLWLFYLVTSFSSSSLYRLLQLISGPGTVEQVRLTECFHTGIIRRPTLCKSRTDSTWSSARWRCLSAIHHPSIKSKNRYLRHANICLCTYAWNKPKSTSETDRSIHDLGSGTCIFGFVERKWYAMCMFLCFFYF